LRDLAFAVEIGADVHICILERGKPICLRADYPTDDRGLQNARPSGLSFEALFRECLESGRSWGFFQRNAVGIRAERLTLKHKHLNDIYFGDMLEPISLQCTTGPHIDWLLTELAEWQPVVEGRALVKSLAKEKAAAVLFRINKSDVNSVRKHLRRLGIKAATGMSISISGAGYAQVQTIGFDLLFHWQGCEFKCVSGAENRGGMSKAYLSVDMMECRKPGIIRASRIALNDLSRQQYRVVEGDIEAMMHDGDVAYGNSRHELWRPENERATELTGEPPEGFEFVKPVGVSKKEAVVK
jgi:hypothetical protein